eukprot:5539504-Prymnesium_polylepis.1
MSGSRVRRLATAPRRSSRPCGFFAPAGGGLYVEVAVCPELTVNSQARSGCACLSVAPLRLRALAYSTPPAPRSTALPGSDPRECAPPTPLQFPLEVDGVVAHVAK